LSPLKGLDEYTSSGLLKFMGGMPELRRRRFFWYRSRWLAGEDESAGFGSSTCSGGVEGGSSASDSGAGDVRLEAWDTLEARLLASEDAEDVVASRRYSTTSHVCRVASGAKETRRLAVGSVSADGMV
jgi:hypothetical protein